MKTKVLSISLFLIVLSVGAFAQTKKKAHKTVESGTEYIATFSVEQTLLYYLNGDEDNKLRSKPVIVEKTFNVKGNDRNSALSKAEKACIEFCSKDEFVRTEKKKDPKDEKKELTYKIYSRNNLKQLVNIEPAPTE